MKLYKQDELCELFRCSRTTLFKLRKKPGFPAPVLGQLLWTDKDIHQYIENSKY